MAGLKGICLFFLGLLFRPYFLGGWWQWERWTPSISMMGSWTAHTKPWDASSNRQTISNKCPPRNGTKGHVILQPLIFRGYDWDNMLLWGTVILLFFYPPFSAFIFLDVQAAPERGTWQMFLTWHRLQGIFVGDSMYVFLAGPIYSCHVTAQVCWHQNMIHTYKYTVYTLRRFPLPYWLVTMELKLTLPSLEKIPKFGV